MNKTALLLLPLALAACAQPPQDTAAPPAAAAPAADADTLPRYHWRLTDARDAQGRRIEGLFASPERPLQLDFAEGRMGVSNVCNRMGGTYTLAGDQLRIGRMVATMMACADQKLMTLEREAGQRLAGAHTIALRAGDTPPLTLTNAGGDVLVFDGAPTAETRYGGPGDTMFLEVAAQTQPCSHPLIPDKRCLHVRELHYDAQGVRQDAPGEWQNFYDDIEGYTHEPGIRSVLRVKRFKREPVPADASSQVYVLDMGIESSTEND